MCKITVYPTGVSGLTPAAAKRIRAQRRPEPQSGIVKQVCACPECSAPISLRYHNAGYVCDTCADKKERGL